nr:hypothetical protein [Archangium violaceum]
MSTRLLGLRPPDARLRPLLGGWFLLVLFLQASCATRTPPGSLLVGYRFHSLTPPPALKEPVAPTAEPGLESATVYAVDFMEPGNVATRPVPIPRAEFQQAFQRLARDVRLKRKSPREAAHEFLSLVATKPDDPWVTMTGYWEVEQHYRSAPTWTPLRQDGPVELIPEAEAALKQKYLKWCEHQGGGDCLGLLASRRCTG